MIWWNISFILQPLYLQCQGPASCGCWWSSCCASQQVGNALKPLLQYNVHTCHVTVCHAIASQVIVWPANNFSTNVTHQYLQPRSQGQRDPGNETTIFLGREKRETVLSNMSSIRLSTCRLHVIKCSNFEIEKSYSSLHRAKN